jgi:hypothetical protein
MLEIAIFIWIESCSTKNRIHSASENKSITEFNAQNKNRPQQHRLTLFPVFEGKSIIVERIILMHKKSFLQIGKGYSILINNDKVKFNFKEIIFVLHNFSLELNEKLNSKLNQIKNTSDLMHIKVVF